MTQIDSKSFKDLTVSLYPDNVTGDISAEDLRIQMDNIADSTTFKTSSTSSPGVQDDRDGNAGNGAFTLGDIWVNTATSEVYVCSDDTTFGATWNKLNQLTPEQIKNLYESNANTNAFTNAEKNKLASIEAGATGPSDLLDGATIKSLYEDEPKAFTDAQFDKLADIDIQRSLDDATSGRLLQAGAFGLGQSEFVPAIDDLNDDTVPSGFYRITDVTANTGYFPFDFALLMQLRYSPNVLHQIILTNPDPLSEQEMYSRMYYFGDWGEWSRYQTVNDLRDETNAGFENGTVGSYEIPAGWLGGAEQDNAFT